MKIINAQFILLFCVLSVMVEGQMLYQIDTLYPVHALEDHLMILEDSTKDISIDQITERADLKFQLLNNVEQPLIWGSIYWASLRLTSKQDVKGWYLQFEAPNKSIGGWGRGNSKVDVYGFIKGERVWHKKSGTDYSRSDRDVKPLWNENRVLIDVNANDTLELYIKIEGNRFGMPPFFNLSLRKPGYEDYFPLYNPLTFFNKFLFGVLFILLLYYTLLFFYLKQRVHLWFAIWLFFTTVTIGINLDVGFINEFLIESTSNVQMSLWVLFSNSTWFVFWFFGREFVGIKTKYPLLDKFILGAILLIFIETVLYLSMQSFISAESSLFYHRITHMFRTVFNFSGLIFSCILLFKKDKLARYFGVGAFIGSAAPIIGTLWIIGIVPLAFDPFVWGTFVQVVAYSFGIAYRQQQKDKAFKKSQKDLLAVERASMEMQRKIELDQLKSKFFANISHEFRTPLSLIAGPLKLAKQNSESEIKISQKTFGIIERNTHRLQELIEQLLDLSKIESGIVDLKLVQGGLIQFVKSIASDYEDLATQKKISYTIHCPEEVDSAYYDKDKVQKIIHNLLSNAFKYTPDGRSVKMIVEIYADQLNIQIKDTGPGIPSSEIDKIFDRFYRIESNEAKGSGIGLALTKELVELMNGSISVDTQLGSGTNFKVRIPIRLESLPTSHQWNEREEDVDTDTNSETAYKEEEKQDIPTVLVVEDNEDLRTYISDVLHPHYKVLLARDGVAGEQMALDHLPNVIISDVMMPKRDGYEMCRLLKSNIITSHIPIILLTAKAGQENKISGLTHGADAYMTKPFDAEELLIRINNFIEARTKIWNQFKTIGGTMVEDISLTSMDDSFFQSIQSEIQDNLSNEDFTVEALAKAVGFSRSQLHRKLKAIINKSPNQLIRETRLSKAKMLLDHKSMSVSEAAYAVGFTNLSYFTKTFKAHYGYLPSELK